MTTSNQPNYAALYLFRVVDLRSRKVLTGNGDLSRCLDRRGDLL